MYYKIVKIDLTSFIMDKFTDLEIQYKLGEFVYADEDLWNIGYGLMVFGSLDDAKNELLLAHGFRIFSCEVEEILEKPPSIYLSAYLNKPFLLGDKLSTAYNTPYGTVCVKGVKLLEEVQSQ